MHPAMAGACRLWPSWLQPCALLLGLLASHLPPINRGYPHGGGNIILAHQSGSEGRSASKAKENRAAIQRVTADKIESRVRHIQSTAVRQAARRRRSGRGAAAPTRLLSAAGAAAGAAPLGGSRQLVCLRGRGEWAATRSDQGAGVGAATTAPPSPRMASASSRVVRGKLPDSRASGLSTCARARAVGSSERACMTGRLWASRDVCTSVEAAGGQRKEGAAAPSRRQAPQRPGPSEALVAAGASRHHPAII